MKKKLLGTIFFTGIFFSCLLLIYAYIISLKAFSDSLSVSDKDTFINRIIFTSLPALLSFAGIIVTYYARKSKIIYVLISIFFILLYGYYLLSNIAIIVNIIKDAKGNYYHIDDSYIINSVIYSVIIILNIISLVIASVSNNRSYQIFILFTFMIVIAFDSFQFLSVLSGLSKIEQYSLILNGSSVLLSYFVMLIGREDEEKEKEIE